MKPKIHCIVSARKAQHMPNARLILSDKTIRFQLANSISKSDKTKRIQLPNYVCSDSILCSSPTEMLTTFLQSAGLFMLYNKSKPQRQKILFSHGSFIITSPPLNQPLSFYLSRMLPQFHVFQHAIVCTAPISIM